MILRGFVSLLMAAFILLSAAKPECTHSKQAGGSITPLGTVPMDLPMKDLDGGVLRLSALSGRAFLVHVWAPWHKESQAQVPLLCSLHEKFHSTGLVIVGLSGDDTPDALKTYARAHDIKYVLATPSEDRQLRRVFGARGVGSLTLLSRGGQVLGEYGVDAAKADIERDIARALGHSPR
jgi:hypothetical protein